MKSNRRSSEGTIGDQLPSVRVITYETRGVVFVRAADLVHWLDESLERGLGDRHPIAVVEEIRDRIAECGAVPRG